ncbi:MAG TPA: hypothetical protein VFJ58_05240 [Armatimonadota bacterium]|nr:hypothetical protein [Armatimonadota bacterium]
MNNATGPEDPDTMDTPGSAVEDHLGMSEEQWAWFQNYTRSYGEQDEEGVDLSLLRENLRLTPSERLARHQRALKFVLEMEHAAEAAGLRAPRRHA